MTMDPIKALQAALKINRPAAVFLTGGFLVLFLAAMLGNLFKDSGLSFWQIPAALVGFSLLVFILSQMQRGAAVAISWALTVLFLVWIAAVSGQVLRGNTLPYAKLDCLTGFWAVEACTVSAAVPDDTPIATPPPPASTPPVAALDRASAAVYIQFAVLPRETVVALASSLVTLGWAVQGADKGGERYDDAAGLSEVRFFHPADKARAQALASEVSANLPGSPSIRVEDVTDSVYAQNTPGHFEIWIGK